MKQHGFVSGKSSVTNLLETFDFITKALSESHNFDGVLLTFDLVPHRRLIHKIRGNGAPNELTVWPEDFFKDRRQRVVLADCISNWKEVFKWYLSRICTRSTSIRLVY